MAKKNNNRQEEPMEKQLWKAELKKGEGEYAGADPEDRDEYRAENVFFVPPEARWAFLQAEAKKPKIGILTLMSAFRR